MRSKTPNDLKSIEKTLAVISEEDEEYYDFRFDSENFDLSEYETNNPHLFEEHVLSKDLVQEIS